MPGRDELIQQNIARASAAAAAPQPQESQGQSSLSGGGGPRSFFGGNFEVYSALDRVEFQGAAGDASMRGNVAYIRIWKRGGSVQQTGSSQQAIEPPQSDSQKILEEDLEAAIGNLDSVANNFDPRTGVYGYNPYGDVDNPIEVAESNVQIAENRIAEERQNAISAQTPTTSAPPSTNVVQTPAPATASVGRGNSSIGAVKSANPNGFVNTMGRVGRALIGLPQTSPQYSGGANAPEFSVAQAPSGEMMWQFLFNPSELELEVGPEFKNSETWGVSDKGNSGQPMHWSHNKNAQLKFNSVLLNGFVFGRKVEVLEQGLIELFMARDGEGQHGPHVLEFVWGKRVFGPCVIKSINIKEKMWDEGEVVNAEVSFTLEQVPEWTINDGFVDVARPGRLGTQGDPTQPGSAAGAAAATDAPATAAPGSGAPPTQKPAQNQGPSSADQSLCNWALEQSKSFQQLYVRVNNPLTAGAFGDPNSIISSFYNVKASLYSGSSEIGNFVDSKVSAGCKRSSYQATVANILKTGGNLAISSQQQALQFVRGCTESTKRAIDEWQRTSNKCKPQRVAGQAARVNESQNALCAKYTGGCSTPGARFGTTGQCPHINGGRGVICSGGVWTPI